MVKKILLITSLAVIFLLSGFSVYSYFIEKDRYDGQTVIPERRDDLPLYNGLSFKEHEYVLKGNHWYRIYEFYKEEMPDNGWKLIHKQAFLENPGGYMMTWEKEDQQLFIDGWWNPSSNETEVKFDLNPVIHTSKWIETFPKEICVYSDPKDNACIKITDVHKIEQIVDMINNKAYDKEDAPLQKEFGVIEVNDLHIEVHYDLKLPSFTLKSELGRKQMKPEKLLELTGLTHLMKK